MTSHKKIVKRAKEATREQGAEFVLFEFGNFSSKHIEELYKVKQLGIKALFYVTGEDKVRKL